MTQSVNKEMKYQKRKAQNQNISKHKRYDSDYNLLFSIMTVDSLMQYFLTDFKMQIPTDFSESNAIS